MVTLERKLLPKIFHPPWRNKDYGHCKEEFLSKVPEVTLIFWIIKILATTLGETGGDAVSMSMTLGYLVSTGIFAVVFIVAVIAQISAKRFHPFLYWTTIIATTTVGTTLADFLDRSLGIGYAGGTTILFALLPARCSSGIALWVLLPWIRCGHRGRKCSTG